MLEGRRIVDRFREIEVELADDAADPAMAPIVDLLIDAGARIGEPSPKIVRALGERAHAPPDVVAAEVGPSSTVEEVVRSTIATSIATPDAARRRRAARRRPRGCASGAGRDPTDPLRPADVPFPARARWRDELRGSWDGWAASLEGSATATCSGSGFGRTRSCCPTTTRRTWRRCSTGCVRRRDAARAEMLSAMREPRYLRLLDALVAAAAEPCMLREVADAPAAEVMGVLMDAPWGHLKKLVRRPRPRLDRRGAARSAHPGQARALRGRGAHARSSASPPGPSRGAPRRCSRCSGAIRMRSWPLRGSESRQRARRPASRSPPVGSRAIEATVRDEARRAWPDAWAGLRRKRLRFWG